MRDGKILWCLMITATFCIMRLAAWGDDKNDSLIVGLDVFDGASKRGVMMALTVYSLPDTIRIGKMSMGFDGCMYEMKFPSVSGKYAIYVDNIKGDTDDEFIRDILNRQGEYEPKWVDVEITEDNLTKKYLTLEPIYVSRPKPDKEIGLDEVTVTASRVKFYYKGDTLVYNADAFVLAEGTMLDGLLKQMPGVELKKDGKIYCNGKYVEELLLDGKNMFSGDNLLMLENIGAYTVKNIEVYRMTGRDSELMGSYAGDGKYVMDVKLKRQYSNGWITNNEAGYGTHNRYMGRLFGMWFSDNAGIVALARMNNLSDISTPGSNMTEEETWSPSNMGQGVIENILGGMSYMVRGPRNRWVINGALSATLAKPTIETSVIRHNYLSSGDTYDYNYTVDKTKELTLSTHHGVEMTLGSAVNLYIMPDFTYKHRHRDRNYVSTTLNNKMENLSRRILLGVYAHDEVRKDTLLNRMISEGLEKDNTLTGHLKTMMFKPLRQINGGRLHVEAEGEYNRKQVDAFNRFELNYGDNPTATERESQYFKNHPDETKKANVYARIMKDINGGNAGMGVEYRYGDESHTSMLYLLDRIEGFDAYNTPIGTLPSMHSYTEGLDGSQSYHSILREHSVIMTPKLTKDCVGERRGIYVDLSIPLELSHRSYEYIREPSKTTQKLTPTAFLIGMNGVLAFKHKRGQKWQFYTMDLSITPRKTPLYSMVDFMDNTDPLNITLGNQNLKSAYKANVRFSTQFGRSEVRPTHRIRVEHTSLINEFSRGYIYNPDNGVMTSRTYNVNGNWNGEGEYTFYTPLDANGAFEFTSTTTGRYNQSVDMVGVSTTNPLAVPDKQRVSTLSAEEEVDVNWNMDKQRFSLTGNMRMNRYESGDAGFEDFTSWTGRFGASGVLNLPRNWGVSTDLTLYIRRGFTDQRLNTQDLVWNARVTKSLLKGSVVVAVDGYDLLRQLTNITYTINAQARTETVSNVIPAYVLVHVQWRWNKQPKR